MILAPATMTTPPEEISPHGLIVFPDGWLHARLCDRDVLQGARRFVLSHPPGVPLEDISFAEIRDFPEEFIDGLQRGLRDGTYHPGPVVRVCCIQRRSKPDYVRLPFARDRVVCVALLHVIEPVLTAVSPGAQAMIGVVRTLLESGCYRLAAEGQGGVISRDALWGLLREVGIHIHDERVRRLIKQLMRAQLTDEVRLAS